MWILSIISLLFSLIIAVIEIWLIYVSYCFRPKYCKKCKGFLYQQKHIKNAKVGLYGGRYIKDYLEFTYSYRVDGIEYRIASGTGGKKGDLPSTVDIVYQQKNPKRAYIKTKNLSTPFYPIVSIVLVPFFILFLIIGFLTI